MAFNRYVRSIEIWICLFVIILLLVRYLPFTSTHLPAIHNNFYMKIYRNIPEMHNFVDDSPNHTFLGNFPNFRFLVNPDGCGDSDVYMLIVIGSNPGHSALRNVLRHTIGEPGIEGKSFKAVFAFGHLLNTTQQMMLEKESEKFKDIIQGNFNDAYRNVTFRDLMGLRWAWKYCPQARFIVRLDDDTSVDIYRLVQAVERYSMKLTTTVGCHWVLENTSVLRTGRYAVTKEEHPGNVYETYCQGWMYVVTPQMAYNLDMASLRVRPYWMNDAYITGTLVKAIGSRCISLNVSYTIYAEELVRSKDAWPPGYVVGYTKGDHNLTALLHHKYKAYAVANNLTR